MGGRVEGVPLLILLHPGTPIPGSCSESSLLSVTTSPFSRLKPEGLSGVSLVINAIFKQTNKKKAAYWFPARLRFYLFPTRVVQP